MTMTKKLATRLGLGAVAAVLLAGGGFYAFQQSRYQVSAEEAQAIALKNAGVRSSEATFVRVEKDIDDWHATYDIKFYTAKGDFDYVIDAETGSILERDHDHYAVEETTTAVASQTVAQETTGATTAGVVSEAKAVISADEAKNKALADAGLNEAAVSQLIVQTDTDDGKLYYEIDFNDMAAQQDYDYKIDAATGEIVERSQEHLLD